MVASVVDRILEMLIEITINNKTVCQEMRQAGLVSGLTDRGLLVMAGHVVPLDAVSVEIVEDGETGLGARQSYKGQARLELTSGCGGFSPAALLSGWGSPAPPVWDQWRLSENLMVLEAGLDQPTTWLAWSTIPPVQKNL